MLLFIPRSLCALKRVAAKAEHARYGATQGIRITLASGLYRAEATDGRRAIVVQGLGAHRGPTRLCRPRPQAFGGIGFAKRDNSRYGNDLARGCHNSSPLTVRPLTTLMG
jgi:hypothetical protein